MEYITDSTDMVAELSKSKRLKQIHKSVRKIKLSEKMGVKYMQKWEELAYAREEGAEIGETDGLCDKGRNQTESRMIYLLMETGQESQKNLTTFL